MKSCRSAAAAFLLCLLLRRHRFWHLWLGSKLEMSVRCWMRAIHCWWKAAEINSHCNGFTFPQNLHLSSYNKNQSEEHGDRRWTVRPAGSYTPLPWCVWCLGLWQVEEKAKLWSLLPPHSPVRSVPLLVSSAVQSQSLCSACPRVSASTGFL